MSQPGPIIVVADHDHSAAARGLINSELFPLIETSWADSTDALIRVRPSAVIVFGTRDRIALQALASAAERSSPYVPLIVADPVGPLPMNALPFHGAAHAPDRFHARLNAALRIRTLHATVLRRLQATTRSRLQFHDNGDPLNDATSLLVGRGGSFPTLSVALGERMGVVGALSIEAAANHLNTRSVDGIVIADGISPRVVDAFLRVLSEDSRFRNLPVIAACGLLGGTTYDLPNLESLAGPPDILLSQALPLIRQSAFESQLNRTLCSLDAGGLLDPRTGLLNAAAFQRDFVDAIDQARSDSSGLSVALFTFATPGERSRLDAARIMSRLIRRVDFAMLRDDGSIIVVFPGTDLRNARAIGRRLSSVLRQTAVSNKPNGKLDNDVTVTSMLPADDASTIVTRLQRQEQRAAS